MEHPEENVLVYILKEQLNNNNNLCLIHFRSRSLGQVIDTIKQQLIYYKHLLGYCSIIIKMFDHLLELQG